MRVVALMTMVGLTMEGGLISYKQVETINCLFCKKKNLVYNFTLVNSPPTETHVQARLLLAAYTIIIIVVSQNSIYTSASSSMYIGRLFNSR